MTLPRIFARRLIRLLRVHACAHPFLSQTYAVSASCLPAACLAVCSQHVLRSLPLGTLCSRALSLRGSCPRSLAPSSTLLQIQLAVDIPDLPLTPILLSPPAFSCASSTPSTFPSMHTHVVTRTPRQRPTQGGATYRNSLMPGRITRRDREMAVQRRQLTSSRCVVTDV